MARVEWREADDHLVSENTEGPPIDRETMAQLVNDFGRQILRRTAERLRLLVALENLGETEVGQRDVAILTHEDVLRLQITIDNLLLMQMAKGESHGQRVELGPLLGELTRLAQVHEQLATTHKLHDEVDSRVRLEDEFHADEERMISLLQNLLLEHRGLNLIELKDGVLTQGLHSVQILRVSLLAQEDLAEATLSNDSFEVKVLQCRGLLCGVTHEDGLTTVLAHFLLLHLKVERGLRVHASHMANILRLGRSGSSLGGLRRGALIINIFLLEAELGVWQDPIGILSVLFARVASLESIGHSINGQILLVLLEALILDSLKYLVSIFALEAVVILAFNVHDELEALVLGATRDGLDA